MSDHGIPLWIIGGFLGSGKTTVLNHLLAQFSDESVGVLINEFGAIGVDSHLLERPGESSVAEVNGGQLFCSCVSGSFVARLAELARMSVSAILVEASGMAKPRALKPILEEVRQSTPEQVSYAGMVSVVDAVAFHKLAGVVNAVEEQVVYGDLIAVNKCDRVDAEHIEETERRLRELNPDAPIVHVEYGGVARDELPAEPVAPLYRTGARGEDYKGWAGRKPLCRTWRPATGMPVAALREELARRLETALRIKGYAETAEGPAFVSATTEETRVQFVSGIPGAAGLTEFYPRS